jgi:hypothetical protein
MKNEARAEREIDTVDELLRRRPVFGTDFHPEPLIPETLSLPLTPEPDLRAVPTDRPLVWEDVIKSTDWFEIKLNMPSAIARSLINLHIWDEPQIERALKKQQRPPQEISGYIIRLRDIRIRTMTAFTAREDELCRLLGSRQAVIFTGIDLANRDAVASAIGKNKTVIESTDFAARIDTLLYRKMAEHYSDKRRKQFSSR